MRRALLALATAATAVVTYAPPASAAPSVGSCTVSYYGQNDYDLRVCDLVSIGTFGTFHISGASAWGQVDCLLSGSSSTNYGGLRSFRTLPGDVCTLHVYMSNYSYGYGRAWTFN